MMPRKAYFQSKRDIISRLATMDTAELLKLKRLYELRESVKHNKYYAAILRELESRGVRDN